jgi:hypothetical protein
MRGSLERQFAKNKQNTFGSSISNFFASKNPFKKDDVEEQKFLENLALLIVKKHLLAQFV